MRRPAPTAAIPGRRGLPGRSARWPMPHAAWRAFSLGSPWLPYTCGLIWTGPALAGAELLGVPGQVRGGQPAPEHLPWSAPPQALCGRLGVVEALGAAVGPIRQRDRGLGAGELLAGLAAVRLAGKDFLAGLDRQRVGAAGPQITPVP